MSFIFLSPSMIFFPAHKNVTKCNSFIVYTSFLSNQADPSLAQSSLLSDLRFMYAYTTENYDEYKTIVTIVLSILTQLYKC